MVWITTKRSHHMERILTTEVSKHTGERVLVSGWLQSWRQLGGINFLVIRDGWGQIQAPKIVAAATESGANVFKLDYFGRPAYLAQSPQFYKQIMVGVFERVFEIGPVFRAEPHDTTRHLSEYVSLDAEFGFIKDHFTVMEVLRDVIAGILATFSERYSAELDLLQARMPVVPGK